MSKSFNTSLSYLKDMPMILSDELFNRDVYERMKDFKIPFGLRDMEYKGKGMIVKEINKHWNVVERFKLNLLTYLD